MMRVLALAIGLLSALPARADTLPPLAKTNPAHADPAPMLPRPPRPPAEAHLTVPAEPITLVIKDTPYRDLGKPDPALSNACKLGRFGVTRSLFRVLLTGKEDQAMLEAVPKHRHDLLIDPDKRARPGEAYYFRNPGWGDCEVRYDGPLPPRTLNERGTTVPPVDWEARKKRALEVWGKREK